MNVPLSIILDSISEYPYECNIPNPKSISFSWVAFLPDENVTDLRPELLYLCTIEQAMERRIQASPSCYFICTAEGEITANTQLPANSVVVCGVSSLIALARVLQDRMGQVRDWIAQLNETMIENPSFQVMLDISELIMNNPVYILDASYKLLAFTHNTVDDDEIDIRLREAGFHSEQTLTAFRECHRFKTYQNETGVIVNSAGNPNRYATIGKWVWDRGMPVLHLIMVCSNDKEPTDSLIALFEILAQNFTLRFKQQQKLTPHTGHYYDSLFNDILFDNLSNPRIIAERTKSSGVPLTGNFNCYKIMPRNVHAYPIAWLMDEFLALLPKSCAIVHEYEIIALNQIDAATEDYNTEVVLPFLKKYDAVCGISEPFNALWEFPIAHTQTCRALGLGEPLLEYEEIWNRTVGAKNATNPPRSRYIFRYDDIFAYYAISSGRTGAFDVYQKTPYLEIVQELIQGDRENNTNNAQMLYTYLVSERKATRTGELLHTHRNNVLYRISKIEKQINLNLEDYWTRFRLLLAFHLTELEQAHQYSQSENINTNVEPKAKD